MFLFQDKKCRTKEKIYQQCLERKMYCTSGYDQNILRHLNTYKLWYNLVEFLYLRNSDHLRKLRKKRKTY